jgi:carboxyl-terminal processing protease
LSDPGSGRPGFTTGFLAGGVVALAIAALVITFTDSEVGGDELTDQAREVIEANYWREVDSAKLEEASVRGMVEDIKKRTDDRFSHYFTPDDFAEFNQATSGQFTGVGLTVTEVPRGLRVASVIPDSPAEQAKLGVGDVIEAVDGDSIAGRSSEVSTARIKGEAGTEVELQVDPAGPAKRRDVTLERAEVRIPAASGRIERTGGDRVAYVRYATFSRGASEELKAEIQRLFARGATGLVLDLRGNGGGLLNEAIQSASLFVEDGDVVTTRSRTRGTQVYDALGDALDPRPTVVLINRDTASAAEILSAAIQSYDLGTIVGEPSFGKGTFQEVLTLPAGGALDLTIGEYLTADDVSLAGKGVQPDERGVDDPRTEPDEGLDEALRILAPELG